MQEPCQLSRLKQMRCLLYLVLHMRPWIKRYRVGEHFVIGELCPSCFVSNTLCQYSYIIVHQLGIVGCCRRHWYLQGENAGSYSRSVSQIHWYSSSGYALRHNRHFQRYRASDSDSYREVANFGQMSTNYVNHTKYRLESWWRTGALARNVTVCRLSM